MAKETHSQALEADALHFSSDILSSLVVLIGLVFVAFGLNKADPIAAVGVSLFVLHAGYVLGKRTIDVLVDTAPEGLIEKVTEITKAVEGVLGIEKLRVRPVGAAAFVDMVVTVSRRLPLERTQAICETIEKRIITAIPEVDLTIQAKPLSLATETIVEQVQIVAKNHDLSVHDIVVHTQNQKKYLSFDLEVDDVLTIKQAHQIANNLEKEIVNEIGEEIEINSHIEPIKSDIIFGENVGKDQEKEIITKIKEVASTLLLVREIHDIQIRKAKKKLFISLHSLFEGNTSLEDAHATASRFEYLVKDKIPGVQRVVVHTEPLTKR